LITARHNQTCRVDLSQVSVAHAEVGLRYHRAVPRKPEKPPKRRGRPQPELSPLALQVLDLYRAGVRRGGDLAQRTGATAGEVRKARLALARRKLIKLDQPSRVPGPGGKLEGVRVKLAAADLRAIEKAGMAVAGYTRAAVAARLRIRDLLAPVVVAGQLTAREAEIWDLVRDRTA
jgi:hypothetical protein